MMIQEEESLKKRLILSLQTCKTEMEKLCLELQLPVFEVTARFHLNVFNWKLNQTFNYTSSSIFFGK